MRYALYVISRIKRFKIDFISLILLLIDAKERISEARENMRKKKTECPDTECLWILGESEAHKKLLTNPVISLFISLKWQKIAPIYSNYQRFMLFFLIMLTWYIQAMFGGQSTRPQSAIHPKENEFCSKQSGKPDSITNIVGDASIYFAFAIFEQDLNSKFKGN